MTKSIAYNYFEAKRDPSMKLGAVRESIQSVLRSSEGKKKKEEVCPDCEKDPCECNAESLKFDVGSEKRESSSNQFDNLKVGDRVEVDGVVGKVVKPGLRKSDSRLQPNEYCIKFDDTVANSDCSIEWLISKNAKILESARREALKFDTAKPERTELQKAVDEGAGDSLMKYFHKRSIYSFSSINGRDSSDSMKEVIVDGGYKDAEEFVNEAISTGAIGPKSEQFCGMEYLVILTDGKIKGLLNESDFVKYPMYMEDYIAYAYMYGGARLKYTKKFSKIDAKACQESLGGYNTWMNVTAESTPNGPAIICRDLASDEKKIILDTITSMSKDFDVEVQEPQDSPTWTIQIK